MATAVVLDNNAKYQIHPIVFNSLKALAVDNARVKMEVAAVPDLTDNSTGTSASAFVDLTIPTAAFDATSAGGATRTAFNTAIGKFEDAGKVLVNSLNNARARLGMTQMLAASGTAAAADTIPAQDKTVATTNGVTALDYTEGRAAMVSAEANLAKIVRGFNEVMLAMGEPVLSGSGIVAEFDDLTLVAIADAAASTTGASAVSKAVADAFLTGLANNLATLATYWNNHMVQATALTDITDSTGGTASATELAANTAPTPANGAATTSSPKAGFDAQLVIIEANLSDMTARLNTIRARYNYSQYTDSTGVTPDTTLAAMTVALTAVDGSSGTVAVDQVTALARMGTINNALSSLAYGVNELAPFFGIEPLTDNLGGTVSTTIADIAATATGVGGASGTPTLLDTAVDAWLVITRNNVASIAAKINGMTGTGTPTKGLGVVAG